METEKLIDLLELSQKIGDSLIKDSEAVAFVAEALRNDVGSSAFVASALEIVHEHIANSLIIMEAELGHGIKNLIEMADA